MHASKMHALTFAALLGVTGFQALSAIAGGIGILATGGVGLGMPLSLLEGSPFDSFLWPGVILLVVLGGTQTIATVLLARRTEGGLLWSAFAGFAMLIWIFVETGIIRGLSVLQVLYFATGIAQLALVCVLLGILPRLPRTPLRRAPR